MSTAATGLANVLRAQASWCDRLGSPLYAGLLDRAADDCEAQGPVYRVLEGHDKDPISTALSLRFMGSVHRLVLDGTATGLAPYYQAQSTGDAWPAFVSTVSDHIDLLRDLIERPVQTNEVGRTCALIGGFARIARETKLPFSLREIGSCAGLLLRFDKYRYQGRRTAWGPAGSPLVFRHPFEEDEPDLDVNIDVLDRAGCDPNPVDPTSEDGRLTLASYVWADQHARLANLRGAIDVATSEPVGVTKANGPVWLEGQLAGQTSGATTVVFHSITLQYLEPSDRQRLRDVITAAGARATNDQPLAWLRFEPEHLDTGAGPFLVTLTLWPGGTARVLASSHPHGMPVTWLDED